MLNEIYIKIKSCLDNIYISINTSYDIFIKTTLTFLENKRFKKFFSFDFVLILKSLQMLLN